uniref:Uncharacterized protein n=1 Tax=Neovison vison TaxID=452646 RepID=A0A8C7AEL3_NEOVI
HYLRVFFRLPFLVGGNAIKFETIEPHLKYLRLITVNFLNGRISYNHLCKLIL